jgi:Protein of unknown function (DUF1553)/Protein of unknown function (DUF1549)
MGIPPVTQAILSRCALALAALLLTLAPTSAALPEPNERAPIIGEPAALVVGPSALQLVGPRARMQVVVTGKYADGSVRDLTALCDIVCEDAGLVTVEGGGFLVPRKNGTSKLTVRAGKQNASVPVTVKEFDKPRNVSFRHEVIAALNVSGCNAGACHGTPSGKNGFKLSLRGFDPDQDFLQLTRDSLGRRTDRHTPDASLLLQKGLGRVPHEGGLRFVPGGLPVNAVRDWLAQGLQDDIPGLPTLTSIEVLPGSRMQLAPARWQQLSVQAKFSDGSIRDVTRFTVFSCSDPSVAEVTPNGFVEFRQAGEVAILCRYLMELHTVRLTYLEPRKGFVWNNPPEANYVDKHVFAKLKMLNITPSDLCSDADFVRRATLDICGVLPTADEVRAFLADTRADKRAKLVDALLERPEYADFWTLKWSDVMRSSRKNIQQKGTFAFQRWLRDHFAKDDGFDVVTRELLTASGSTFSNPPANYYRIARDPQNLAETTAQLFLGFRMQCAKCHNHPFERWTQDDYYSLSAFFARVHQKKDVREPGPKPNGPGAEIIYASRNGEVTQPRTGKTMAPKFPGGGLAPVAARDRREALAEWMTSPENAFFARSTVNRIWYHLNGRGIVDPVDDFRDSNPSANDELLDALAKDFAANHFRFKHLIRVIATSRSYQLSAGTNELNKDDSKYFSHAVTKLLPAEPLLDALCTALDVPEKFAGMPAGTRAVQLPDGEFNHPFLKTFGQPARELACECERESDSNLAQALQLINGPTVNEKLRAPNNRIGRLIDKKVADSEMLHDLYLTTLSRQPTPEDVEISLKYVRKATDRRKAWEDVQWALINSKEFLFRH